MNIDHRRRVMRNIAIGNILVLILLPFVGSRYLVDFFAYLVICSVTLVASSIYYIALFVITRRIAIRRPLLTAIFALPSVVVIGIILLMAYNRYCIPEPPTEKTVLVSPSKKYVMKMKTEGTRMVVYIYSADGNLLYHDTDSDFIVWLGQDWLWDKHDRFWLFNSDDSRIYYWEYSHKHWQKNEWDHPSKKIALSSNSHNPLKPPPDIIPPELRKSLLGG